jgi:transcriptional regulator with XRE-family HTH domain
VTQEALAIRMGTERGTISAIESGAVSPRIAVFAEMLELLGEELSLAVEKRVSGVDLTLNQGNLQIPPDLRVMRGLAFADLVRENRAGGNAGLGRLLEPGPIFQALLRHGGEFTVIGSIAGLAHGSAYPTFDLDLAWSWTSENLTRLRQALDDLGVRSGFEVGTEIPVFSFDTAFGRLDVVCRVPGIRSYEELRRDATLEVIADFRVPVASLDHLIAMKRASTQRKDGLMVLEYVDLADEIRRREAENKET